MLQMYIMLACIAQLFAPKLAKKECVRIAQVSAVYGKKLAWSTAHGGQEPPVEVVRLSSISPKMLSQD